MSELLHRRATSNKVAASRERRVKRLNGRRKSGFGGFGHRKQSSDGNRLAGALVIAAALAGISLVSLWIRALVHVSEGPHKTARNGHGTNGIDAHARGGDTSSSGNESPYTTEALNKNPYLGWQPKASHPHHDNGKTFSVRECFKNDPKTPASKQPYGCSERPDELGPAPPVEKDWVPDVTMIRKMLMYGKDIDGQDFPPALAEEFCEDIGVQGGRSGDTNKECVLESMIRTTGPLNSTTVTIHPSNHYGTRGENSADKGVTVRAPRLMCLVYTMADAHSNRIRAMRETWAGGCDGFLAFSTESDPRLPAISLEHEGPESYDNMWQKVRSIWRFVGTHYLEDYDFFFQGGDDLFVMPHNLKTYLASLTHKDGADPKTATYFVGRRFNSGGAGRPDYFNSGGAGYALSQATLRAYLENMDDTRHCAAAGRTSMEDVMIARCLSHLGISFTDTRDQNGRERFHPFAPGSHLHWRPPGPKQPRDWYEDYNSEWGILQGRDCCAPDSVSFHYVKKASMVRHMHALLNSCDLIN
mmetsp:Transcript_6299/g.14537  ORF Transcript_6299/g.14537 Transcript_6299/m.14537 type:complete len:529 (-) Transcript_6299:69-1655(-)